MNKIQILPGFIGLILILLFAGCSSDDDPGVVICTEEFRMIGVKVNGDELDNFYTLRVETGDEISFTEGDTYPLVNWYPILDDSYQTILEGVEEEFQFVGEIDGNEVLRENYVIGADQCHIYKVSGPQSIDL
jgi:hypothetical protein